MPLVTRIPSSLPVAEIQIPLPVDRHTLGKRRWRTRASDGCDIAVDLEKPCADGTVVHVEEGRVYVVEQLAEPVFRIRIPESPAEAARLGWIIGNQHLPVEIRDGFIWLARDDTLPARMTRLGLQGESLEAVFRPEPHSAAHHHH